MKTITEVIDYNWSIGGTSRAEFWTDIRELIRARSYAEVIRRIRYNSADTDYLMQIAIVLNACNKAIEHYLLTGRTIDGKEL